MYPRALSIAGSDSCGGAGIQADLKTFTVLDVYGMTAITAVTVQNTRGVERIFAIPPDVVQEQIDAVLTDIGCDAIKTGMLFSTETVLAVARALHDRGITRLVIDPVLVAGTGAALAQADLPQALLAELIPRALLVTPNINEATILTGIEISTVADMRAAASKLIDAGAQACLVKGGHLSSGAAVDIFMMGGSARELVADRLPVVHTHGTGCQLSASITAFLAAGHPLDQAVDKGKVFITKAIEAGLDLGHGPGPANPLACKR